MRSVFWFGAALAVTALMKIVFGPDGADLDGRTFALAVSLATAIVALSERERFIVTARKLSPEPRTLESLGHELGLSKERVRQLEAAAFQKMRRHLEAHGRELRHFLS